MSAVRRRPGIWRRIRAAYHLWSGRVHRHYGIVHYDTREFISAVEQYGEATSLNPLLADAYLERGILQWRELGRAPHAIRDLTTALALRPGWAEALFNRGLAHQAAGNFGAAMDDLAAYLDLGEETWRETAASQLAHLRELLNGHPALEHRRHGA